MSNFDKYIEILDEGIFSAEKIEKKLRGKTQEEVNQKLQDFLSQYKEYNPKPAGMGSKYKIKTDRSGFYIDVTHDEVKAAEDTSVKGLAKRAGKAIGGKIAGTVKDIIPKERGTIEGSSVEEVQAQIKQLKRKLTNVYVSDIKQKDDKFYAIYRRSFKEADDAEKAKAEKKAAKETKQTLPQENPNTKRISNIQKQIEKLSDEKLTKIETWLKTVKQK